VVSSVEPHSSTFGLEIVLRDFPSCADPELTLCLPLFVLPFAHSCQSYWLGWVFWDGVRTFEIPSKVFLFYSVFPSLIGNGFVTLGNGQMDRLPQMVKLLFLADRNPKVGCNGDR
jgi:hypothetical protein